jgi:hypothetical protein
MYRSKEHAESVALARRRREDHRNEILAETSIPGPEFEIDDLGSLEAISLLDLAADAVEIARTDGGFNYGVLLSYLLSSGFSFNGRNLT